MKVLYSKYDKTKIGSLPRIVFPGRKIVIITEDEARKAVDYLLQQDLLGFDTETRPVFKKGRTNKVALLQVSTHDTCFLFRLNKIGMPPSVIRFLEDKEVLKVGLSWHDDLIGLKKRMAFTPGYFVDLQDMVSDLGVEDMSLQKLYANFFHKKINKRQQLTNWEKNTLDDKQQMYAALDAWACIHLYEEMMRLKKSGDYELVKVIETKEEPNTEDDEDV